MLARYLVIPLLLTIVVLPASALGATDLSACGVARETIGAGPAGRLSSLTGPSFDRAYIRHMYQQHSDIAAFASFGATSLVVPGLRSLAVKIRDEQVDLNKKLALWHGQMGGKRSLSANRDRYEEMVSGLDCATGIELSMAWSRAMIALLDQSRQASDLAQSQAASPELRNQAKIVSRSASNEIEALHGWMEVGYATPDGWYWYPGYDPYWGVDVGFGFGGGFDHGFHGGHSWGGGMGAGPHGGGHR